MSYLMKFMKKDMMKMEISSNNLALLEMEKRIMIFMIRRIVNHQVNLNLQKIQMDKQMVQMQIT